MTLDPLNTVTKTKLLLFIPQPSKVNMFVSEFLQMYPESNSWCKNRKKLFNFQWLKKSLFPHQTFTPLCHTETFTRIKTGPEPGADVTINSNHHCCRAVPGKMVPVSHVTMSSGLFSHQDYLLSLNLGEFVPVFGPHQLTSWCELMGILINKIKKN